MDWRTVFGTPNFFCYPGERIYNAIWTGIGGYYLFRDGVPLCAGHAGRIPEIAREMLDVVSAVTRTTPPDDEDDQEGDQDLWWSA